MSVQVKELKLSLPAVIQKAPVFIIVVVIIVALIAKSGSWDAYLKPAPGAAWSHIPASYWVTVLGEFYPSSIKNERLHYYGSFPQ